MDRLQEIAEALPVETRRLLRDAGGVLAWRALGECAKADADPEVFFPKQGGSTKAARDVCARCLVKEICSDPIVTGYQPIGVWGDTSGIERRKARSKAAKMAKTSA